MEIRGLVFQAEGVASAQLETSWAHWRDYKLAGVTAHTVAG